MGSSKPIGFESDCGITVMMKWNLLVVVLVLVHKTIDSTQKIELETRLPKQRPSEGTHFCLRSIPDISDAVSGGFFKICPVLLKRDEKINPKIN